MENNLHAWHTCDRDWIGPLGQIDLDVQTLYADISAQFTLCDVSKLAGCGGDIAQQIGGIYPELCDVRELEMENIPPQAAFVVKHRHLFPERADQLIDVM